MVWLDTLSGTEEVLVIARDVVLSFSIEVLILCSVACMVFLGC